MPILDRIAARLGYVKPAAFPVPPRVRVFQAAKVDRLTAGFSTSNTSINQDLRSSLEALRARSRLLSQNNDYLKRFLQMVATNIVGPSGFQLQSAARFVNGKLDKGANDAIENAWRDWVRRGVCDVTGKLSFVDLQRMAIRSAARDGEYLVRRHWAPDVNVFGFALQVLEVDRLDVQHNEVLASGNRVVMGIEIDGRGAPVAYHLLAEHPGEVRSSLVRWNKTRVPAADIYHGFIVDRPEQVRGFPWAHTAMLRLNHLSGYEESAIIAARVGAAKMGWIVSPDGTLDGIADDQDEQGNSYTEVEAGAIGTLPPGYDFKQFDPAYPDANFDPFVRAMLRGISAGLGVSYHSLANDLSSVNYSSARAGTLEERDEWTSLQGWFIESFLAPVFTDWLRASLLQGAIRLPNGSSLPLEKFGYLNRPTFIGRRWSWVDPKNDLEAVQIAIQNKLKSRRKIMAEMGLDLEDEWEQIAQEADLAESLDLDLPEDVDAAAAMAPAQQIGEGNGTADDAAGEATA